MRCKQVLLEAKASLAIPLIAHVWCAIVEHRDVRAGVNSLLSQIQLEEKVLMLQKKLMEIKKRLM